MKSIGKQILFLALALWAGLHAYASNGVKVDKGQCKLKAIQDYLRTSSFKGFDICEGMGNPSQEQDQCIEKHGGGSFDNGVKVVKKRQVYNAWTSGVIVQIDFAKEKIPEDSLTCKEWLEVINSWSGNPKSGLVYPHRKEARKLVIKDGKVQFAKMAM